MNENDPSSYGLVTWLWVILLSCIGGIVRFLNQVKDKKFTKRIFFQLFIDILTSGFVGVLTFFGCEAAEMSPLITAILVGVSGHMGARSIYLFQTWFVKRIGGV